MCTLFDQHWFLSWALEEENTDFVSLYGARGKGPDCILSWLQLCCYWVWPRVSTVLTRQLNSVSACSKCEGLLNRWVVQSVKYPVLDLEVTLITSPSSRTLSPTMHPECQVYQSPWWSLNIYPELMTMIGFSIVIAYAWLFHFVNSLLPGVSPSVHVISC